MDISLPLKKEISPILALKNRRKISVTPNDFSRIDTQTQNLRILSNEDISRQKNITVEG
jgi:hypothetical protein|tara:strand:- start:269 stop:445 length:177 start_codon:yes stop_codon:yes gene_type:complete